MKNSKEKAHMMSIPYCSPFKSVLKKVCVQLDRLWCMTYLWREQMGLLSQILVMLL